MEWGQGRGRGRARDLSAVDGPGSSLVYECPAPVKEENQLGRHSIAWNRAKGPVSFWCPAQPVVLFKDPAQGPGRRLF